MKMLLHTLLCGTLAGAVTPWTWADEIPDMPMESKAAIVMLPQALEVPLGSVQPRLRDSLQSLDLRGAEQAQAYPYRLSADERRRMREQLRGQAPALRESAQ